jgi:hypothetical protein
MSFLTKTSMPRAAVLSATRMPIVAQRTFTTSPFSQKTVTESVKDGLKKTDRVVSDNIAIPAVDAVGACLTPPLPIARLAIFSPFFFFLFYLHRFGKESQANGYG